MSFQSFCNESEGVDQQVVRAERSFIINFSKPNGSAFSVDPNDIIIFLKYISENAELCRETIMRHKDFSGEEYTQYKEDPYRALYALPSGDARLKTIRSLGGSQTNGLTKVISKLICYLAKIPYDDIKNNTHFDKYSVDKALMNMPDDMSKLDSDVNLLNDTNRRKLLFELWLKKNGLSDRTVSSYVYTAINYVDKLLSKSDQNFTTIYDIVSYKTIESLIGKLSSMPEWVSKNSTGNSMYSSALNNYLDFVKTSLCFSTLPKPFILLAGMSGTGKTRFVREQAERFDANKNNYCLVPVRPDWHEPSDLLGYVSRISGKPVYVSTKVLGFMINAWRVIAPDAGAEGSGELDLTAVPYWLCLDEMNLAPVEQYFADYLSVLESRDLRDGEYRCEALLDKSLLQDLDKNGGTVQKELGLEDDEGLWQYFVNHGIAIPPNLIVAGTVNMDETTHGFSRKVIDRALSFDFGEFFPNDYSSFFEPDSRPKVFSYPLITQAKKDDLTGCHDENGEKSIAFLESVNGILRRTPFELAYRALNELLLQVICFKPEDEAQLQAVWDDFLMSKVLPRIDGDEDKLRIKSEGDAEDVLQALSTLLEEQLNIIWSGTRKDFYRESSDGGDVDEISCRTKEKLQWMKDRLEINTFTSFWP